VSEEINFGQQLFESCTHLKELHAKSLDDMPSKSCLEILKLDKMHAKDIDTLYCY